MTPGWQRLSTQEYPSGHGGSPLLPHMKRLVREQPVAATSDIAAASAGRVNRERCNMEDLVGKGGVAACGRV
jgi:hypothetical protein